VTFAGLGALADAAIGSMGLATLASTGLGMATDTAVGAGDQLVLSKMAKGWKPNQFIDGPAKAFLGSPDQ
jgi:hypothetical protein